MCRFIAYLGPPILVSHLVTDPANSMIHQSSDSHLGEVRLNGDGFGVAWYQLEVSPEPAAFRSITPAWSNQNLRRLARVTRSRCILAHVRAASPGLPVTETNTHPFLSGRYAFMHNGEIGGFYRIKRTLLNGLSDHAYRAIEGTTDSEHLFAQFLEYSEGGDGKDPADEIAQGLRRAIGRVLDLARDAGVEQRSWLNIAVTDGRNLVVSRYTDGDPGAAPSLYFHFGRRYVCEGGVCRMVEPGEEGHAVIVASEPVGNDPGWEPVPPNHMVIARERSALQVAPFVVEPPGA